MIPYRQDPGRLRDAQRPCASTGVAMGRVVLHNQGRFAPLWDPEKPRHTRLSGVFGHIVGTARRESYQGYRQQPGQRDSVRPHLAAARRPRGARHGRQRGGRDILEACRGSEITARHVAGFGCPRRDAGATRAESGARPVRRLQEIQEFNGGQSGRAVMPKRCGSACPGTAQRSAADPLYSRSRQPRPRRRSRPANWSGATSPGTIWASRNSTPARSAPCCDRERTHANRSRR